ncbi:hypothetical protein Vafri_11226 [Volvox africanus]|nr:hypothetical protein Vafri_11226 [Volvox africanus]
MLSPAEHLTLHEDLAADGGSYGGRNERPSGGDPSVQQQHSGITSGFPFLPPGVHTRCSSHTRTAHTSVQYQGAEAPYQHLERPLRLSTTTPGGKCHCAVWRLWRAWSAADSMYRIV